MTTASAMTSAAPAAEPSPPWPAFLTACISAFLVSVDATVLYTAFAALRASFAASTAAELSWVLNAYTVVYAALLVPSGRLADGYGHRRMFVLGTLLFMLASLGCGLANDIPTLVAARVLQAIGAALLTPASLALVLRAFPVERRAVAVSLWGAVGGFAAAIGPSLGSALVDTLGWRWAFLINVPPALWALYRARRHLPPDAAPPQRAPLDLTGIALLVSGVGSLTAGVLGLESHAPTHPRVWGPTLAGALFVLAFVPWARRHPAPALDLSLFESRTYTAVNMATVLFAAAFSMMFFGFFFFMTGIWHYSLPMAGLAMTPGPLMVVPVAMLGGRVAARIGHRPLLVLGCVLLACGGGWQGHVPTAEPQYLLHWLPSQLMTGVGVGLALPSLSGAAVASLDPARFGVGSAVNQAMRQFGSVVGVAITVLIAGPAGFDLAAFHSLTHAYTVLALLAALCCLAVNTRPRAASAGTSSDTNPSRSSA